MIKVKKNKGFTLVELLVVIAIISIISVIAVPNLYKSINKAKSKKLLVEMNLINNAITEYYLEHGTLDLKITDNNQGVSKTNHMHLKDHKPLQACFDSEVSDTPFGGWYYITDKEDKIEVTLSLEPPKEERHDFKEAMKKMSKAAAGLETIKSLKEQIEKESNGKIKVSADNGFLMEIDKE